MPSISKCQTSASNAISISNKYEISATPINESMSSSEITSVSLAVKATSNRAGDLTTHLEALDSTSRCSFSQPQTPTSEQEHSVTSTTSNVLTSLLSGEDYFKVSPTFVVTETHKMLLECVRNGNKWQEDLELVHGLTEAESCECFSIAGKYLHSPVFPEGATNAKLFRHAKTGWEHLKKVDELAKKYPQEFVDVNRRALAEGKRMGDF